MTPAALLASVLASLPEIIVITGACVLLIVGLFRPERPRRYPGLGLDRHHRRRRRRHAGAHRRSSARL